MKHSKFTSILFLDDEPLDFNLTRLFDASLKGQASFFISEQVSSKAKNIISLSKNHLESIMEGVKYNIQDDEEDDVTNDDSESIKAQCGKNNDSLLFEKNPWNRFTVKWFFVVGKSESKS